MILNITLYVFYIQLFIIFVFLIKRIAVSQSSNMAIWYIENSNIHSTGFAMTASKALEKEVIESSKAACCLAMQRIINASRYEKSDVAEYLGLSVAAIDRRMRGAVSFALEEAMLICRLMDIPLADALKIADMSDEEFQNAWIYQWRRQNLAKYVAHLEADKGMTHTQIAEMCGYTKGWISKILAGKGKLIGRICRVVEQRLGLPDEWLDRKPMTPPKGQQINTDMVAKTSSQLLGAVKQAGFDVDSELLVPYLTAVSQLYNARMAARDGYDPETDAAQFQAVFDQLTMQLKMKEGLWKF